MDCSLPGSSVCGLPQARIVEWVAISFSRGSSRPRGWTQVSRIAGRRFTLWATKPCPMDGSLGSFCYLKREANTTREQGFKSRVSSPSWKHPLASPTVPRVSLLISAQPLAFPYSFSDSSLQTFIRLYLCNQSIYLTLSFLTSPQISLLFGTVYSLMAQRVNLPAMQETQEMRIRSLDWEDTPKKEMQPAPVFLPEKSCGQRSLEGYSLWSLKELGTTERLSIVWYNSAQFYPHLRFGTFEIDSSSSSPKSAQFRHFY